MGNGQKHKQHKCIEEECLFCKNNRIGREIENEEYVNDWLAEDDPYCGVYHAEYDNE